MFSKQRVPNQVPENSDMRFIAEADRLTAECVPSISVVPGR